MQTQTSSKGVEIPELQTFLKAGVQFGHETKRWNPRMKKYIFTTKDNIHIIDVSQTIVLLEKALRFLSEAARRGSIMFIGTKRQATDIIQEEAIKAGAYFVSNRWAGGLLTNFNGILRSLNRLNKLESMFETGVEGRTKFEISQMKKEWERLNRLYGGIKGMQKRPSAVVIIDPRYEIGAVAECRRLKIPIVAITDTNCNPDVIDYVVPANDDAMGSLKLLLGLFREAILLGNGGQGVKHNLKDYLKVEVKIIKQIDEDMVKKQDDVSKAKFRVRRIEENISQAEPQKIKEEKVVVEKKEIKIKDIEKKEVINKKGLKKKTTKKEVKDEKKDLKINNEVSQKVLDILRKEKITLAKAKKLSKEELLEIKGIGPSAVQEILG